MLRVFSPAWIPAWTAVALLSLGCSREQAPPPELQLYLAPVRQIGDVFRYFGSWSRRPDKIERSVQVGEFEFFQSEAGLLRMQRNGDRKVKEFNSFRAASSQGYLPPSSENLPSRFGASPVPVDVCGLAPAASAF